MKRSIALASLVALAFSACSSSSSIPTAMSTPGTPATSPLQLAIVNGSPGFVSLTGAAVYVLDADLAKPGQSTCIATNLNASGAPCPQIWPPVASTGTSLPPGWTIIARTDGIPQLAFKGRPLYTFIRDTTLGTAVGDGVTAFGGTWHVARLTPSGA